MRRPHASWRNGEIKPAPGHAARTGRIVGETTAAAFADQSRGAGWPLFSSFDVDALDAARQAAPHVPRGLLFDAVPEDASETARRLGCVGVHLNHRGLDLAMIAALHGAGFAVLAYTVNDLARVEALEAAGIDAVVTDRIDRIAP